MKNTNKAILIAIIFSVVGFTIGIIVTNAYADERFLDEKKHLVEVLEFHSKQRELLLILRTKSEVNMKELWDVLEDSTNSVKPDSMRRVMDRSFGCLNDNAKLLLYFEFLYEADSVFLSKFGEKASQVVVNQN